MPLKLPLARRRVERRQSLVRDRAGGVLGHGPGLEPAAEILLGPPGGLGQSIPRRRRLGEGAAGEARLREVLARDPRQPGSERRRLPNGRFVEILWAPTEAGGQVVTFADITALATAKAAARDHAALLQTMQETWWYGGDWKIHLVEPAWGTWFLLSLLFWRAGLPYLAQLRYPLTVSVIAALVVGLLLLTANTLVALRSTDADDPVVGPDGASGAGTLGDDAVARGLERVGPWLFPLLTAVMALPLLLV